MTVMDSVIALVCVVGFILIIYSGMRKQSLIDTIREIKEIFTETSGDLVGSTPVGLKYAN